MSRAKERGIIMTAESVRAILAGSKTQTRRLLTPRPEHLQHHEWRGQVVYEGENRMWCWRGHTFDNIWDFGERNEDRKQLAKLCPLGAVGDQLWVKESFTLITGNGIRVHYRADGEPTDREGRELPTEPGPRRWMSPLFMPRNLSRITLEVTEVRVQRLQEISDDDAQAEGVTPYTPPHGHVSPGQRVPGPGFDRCRLGDQPHRLPYADRWDEINGKKHPWSANPWVWALTFRRVIP